VNPDHLFLGTQQDNLNDAIVKGRMSHGTRRYNAKLTEEIVATIRRLWQQGASIWGLAREYGVSTHTMDCALKRKTWKHVT
jgi:transposase-like protein